MLAGERELADALDVQAPQDPGPAVHDHGLAVIVVLVLEEEGSGAGGRGGQRVGQG
jgi:hypothetical protein